jgi:hypothetical protein
MSCHSFEELAAIATGKGDDVHAATCARCAALIEEQRAIRALARSLRPPTLEADRRVMLAAEIMAAADAPPRRRTRLAIGLGLGAAAAAAIVFVVRASVPASPMAAAIAHEPPDIHVPDRSVAAESVPLDPEISSAEIRPAADADLTRDTTPERDIVTLRAGTLAIDARATRGVQVRLATTRVEIARARAQITAKQGTIETVRVFAGSVEVIDNGKRHVIVAGATWDRLSPPVATPALSMAAFRDGWTALRAGDHAAAIAAFDRAIDPVVVEDAVYWAAVASERAGLPDAKRRFTDFLARFPTSPRADAARTAIDRL